MPGGQFARLALFVFGSVKLPIQVAVSKRFMGRIMKTPTEFIREELDRVEDVVNLACKVEELRRGVAVSRHDQEVQILAAEIILNGVGAELRRRCGSVGAA